VEALTRETVSRGLLMGTIAASTLAWSFLVVSFHDVKIAALWVGLSACWAAQCRWGLLAAPGFRAWLPAWSGLLLVSASGYLRAPVPWLVVEEALRVAALLLFAGVVYRQTRTARGRHGVFLAIACAGGAAGALALAQGGGWLPGLFPSFGHYDQTMYSVFGNEGLLGGYLALALVLLPGALGLEVGRGPTWRTVSLLAAGIVMFAALVLSESRAGQLAFLAGGLVLAGSFRPRSARWAIPALGALLALTCLAIALGGGSVEKWTGTLSEGDTGVQVRLWIGRAALAMAAVNPMSGLGLGNFAYWAPQFMGAAAGEYANDATTYHAHFDLLELFVETGVLGFLFLGWLFSRFRLRSRVALAGLVALAVFSCGYPAWASLPHALAAVLLLGMNLRPELSRPSPSRRRMWFPLAVTVTICAAASAHVATALWPSYLLRRAEDAHLAGEESTAAYRKAIAGLGFRGEAREGLGLYLLGQGDGEGAWEQLDAARREVDTGRLYYLLYRAAIMRGDLPAAEAMKEAGIARWPWAASRFDTPE